MATALTVFHHLLCLFRIIEYFPRGWRLHRGHPHARREGRGHFRLRSAGRLHADHHVSIVSCGDAIFSFFPPIPALQNLVRYFRRGDAGHPQPRESKNRDHSRAIFLAFVATHVVLIGYDSSPHSQISALTGKFRPGLKAESRRWNGRLVLLFLRAFSMGGGTYTGIEAVSNASRSCANQGPQRQATMVYLSSSLAVTAGGILVCYLIMDVGRGRQTLNAVLAGKVFGGWSIGPILALVTFFLKPPPPGRARPAS